MLLAISTHVWLSNPTSSVMSRSLNQLLIPFTIHFGHFIVFLMTKSSRTTKSQGNVMHMDAHCLHTEHVCVPIVGLDAATPLFRYCDLKMFIHLFGTPCSFRICHSYTRWTLLKASLKSMKLTETNTCEGSHEPPLPARSSRRYQSTVVFSRLTITLQHT